MIHRFLQPALGGVLAITLAAGPALAEPAAAPSPGTSEQAVQLDQSIQVLKEQALDIKAREQRAEDELLYPDSTRLLVYLSVPATALLVRSIKVTIDGGDAALVDLDQNDPDENQAIALQNRGLLTVLRTNVPAGIHTLLAEVVSHYKDADEKNPPFVSQLSAQFSKSDEPAEVELVLSRDVNQRPALRYIQWSVAK